MVVLGVAFLAFFAIMGIGYGWAFAPWVAWIGWPLAVIIFALLGFSLCVAFSGRNTREQQHTYRWISGAIFMVLMMLVLPQYLVH